MTLTFNIGRLKYWQQEHDGWFAIVRGGNGLFFYAGPFYIGFGKR